METIYTERLELIPMSAEFLERCLEGDLTGAARILGVSPAPDWMREEWLMELRLRQIKADPETEPWLLWAITTREERVMVGQIGFHDKPGAAYLKDYAPGGLEMGYTVYPGFRLRGYAREAIRGLMGWARAKCPNAPFVVSISPDNIGSLHIAKTLGFVRVGEHIDDIDGLEYILVKENEIAR